MSCLVMVPPEVLQFHEALAKDVLQIVENAPLGWSLRHQRQCYQPILTFLSETQEYISGELRNGDRPTGAQIARHLESVCAALPPTVKTIYARADAGFYCWQAVEAYQKRVPFKSLKTC
jgi:hypothetical protein